MIENICFDVFVSHSTKDKAIVRPLAERLRAAGLKVWFDEWVIKPGDSIPAKIEQGLEDSRVLLLCMSAQAFGSDWAQLEAGTFRFRDPLNRERRFIPLRLDDSPIKGSLAQFLYIDWRPANREQEYKNLLQACRPPVSWPLPKILADSEPVPGITQFSDSEYGVIITEIVENATDFSPIDRTVTQILVDTMGDLLNSTPISKDRVVVVKPLGKAIPVLRGHEAALELARSVKAKLVVWGWYSKDDRTSLMRLNVDLGEPDLIMTPIVQNLDDPRVTPANYVQQFGTILNWPRNDEVFSLAFTVSSVQEASASVALIIGFIAYVRAEYEQAKWLLTTLTQENKKVNPLVRAYTHFLLGNIYLAQALSESDMRRHALSEFIAANEYLESGQEHSRILRAKIKNNIGAILISFDDYDHADKLITEAIQESSGNATAHANKGRILLARAGHDREDGGLWFLADTDIQTERTKAEAEGVASMLKALSINPNLLTARLWLAKVAISRNDLTEAAEKLKPVFAAFEKLDPQHAPLPDRALIQFIHEFGPEFSADLVLKKHKKQVLNLLTAYLHEQERLFRMFSTMNPRAMGMAGRNAADAKSAIARLKKVTPPSTARIPHRPSVEHSRTFASDFRGRVQTAISAGRSREAIAMLLAVGDEQAGWGSRYVLGKLLFEMGEINGACKAISVAIEQEISSLTFGETAWLVKFADGERRATYSNYVDIIAQSITQQSEYESVVGNLTKRAHLLGATQIGTILSLKHFSLPPEHRLDLLVNLGGALAKEDRFAESAAVFAEASHLSGGEQKLTMLMSELKMRSLASEPLEVLCQLQDALQSERRNLQPQPSAERARFIDLKIGLWRCELAVRAGIKEDARCREALSDATHSDKILTAYYKGQFALMRGDEAEWVKILEEVAAEHQFSYNSTAFNEVESRPRDPTFVFENILRELAAYYRRSGGFTNIGKLLFGEWKSDHRSHHYFERQRLEGLRAVLFSSR